MATIVIEARTLMRHFLITLACISVLLTSSAFGQTRTTNRKPKAEQSTKSPAKIPTVGLFDGLRKGQIAAKLVQQSEKTGAFFLKNQSTSPLNVQFPETFIGFHVMNQPNTRGAAPSRTPTQQSTRLDPATRAQTTAGSISAGTQRVGARGEPEVVGLFSVSPQQVLKLPVTSVCLEFGRPTPRSNMSYLIVSVEDYTRGNVVLQELIPLFAKAKVDQRSAQTAAWHVANGLSWSKLSRLQPAGFNGLPSRDSFKRKELETAKELVAKATQMAAARKQDPKPSREPSSASSSSRTQR
ncbi:MAG: hypothetical protein CMJ78_21215 [Planctomycetaceae bacterium]|nr:hypothetical protein [Planctomycetaceae bacterium]